MYFAIGVFLDLFLLGATTFAGINYSTNAEAFQKAVKQVEYIWPSAPLLAANVVCIMPCLPHSNNSALSAASLSLPGDRISVARATLL